MALYRAQESDFPDALFCDPYARRMAGERGHAIVDALGRSLMGWSTFVRTAVIDGVILRFIEHSARTGLNFGAGLDTRAFRLQLPPTLRWLDVDLSAVTDHRRECLGAAACRHVHVEADPKLAAERQRVISWAATYGPVLVLTEGLLVYLASKQVSALATQLRNEVKVRWWVADV